MTDNVAERLAERAALTAGIEDHPELVELLDSTVEATADNLEDRYTVPELKEQAELIGADLTGASLKREIAEAIASHILERPAEEAVQSAEDMAEPEVQDVGPAVEDTVPDVEAHPDPAAAEDAMVVPDLAQNAEQDDIRPIEGGGQFVQLRHVTRTLVRFGNGDGEGLLDAEQAREVLSGYLRSGYDLLFVEHLGFDSTGHMMLWGFGLPNDPEQHSGHEEIYTIVRTIGPSDGALTGFQADAFISSYLAEGYELFNAKQLGLTASGINMLWVLVR